MMVFRFTRKTDCKLKNRKEQIEIAMQRKRSPTSQGVSTELLVNNAHENSSPELIQKKILY